MRRVSYFIALTLDGLYADPDGGLDAVAPDAEEHRYANELTRTAGDIVMGRVMYEVMAYWDTLDLDDPDVSELEREFATIWRERRKHVVSRGRPPLRANATLLEGEAVEAVRAMRAGDGPDIAIGGGAELFATLAAADLIDDFRFLVMPRALGAGKALFAALPSPLALRLTASRTFPSGSLLLEYTRADA